MRAPDIFAFGALLFEMLSGRRAFEGKTRASLLGSILKDEPPAVSTFQPQVSKTVERIITTCLAKDADDRYQSARDLLRDLKWATSMAAAEPVAPAIATQQPPAIGSPGRSPPSRHWHSSSWRRNTCAKPRHAWNRFNSRSSHPPTPRSPHDPAAARARRHNWPSHQTAAVSSSWRAPRNRFQLWLRSLDSAIARPIAGTEDASFPFGRRTVAMLAFSRRESSRKRQLPVAHPRCCAMPRRVEAVPGIGKMSLSSHPQLWLAAFLLRIPSAGGNPQAVSTLDKEYGETFHRFPSFLPDGRHFLYNASVGTCCPPSKPGRIRIGMLDSMESTTVVEAESSAAFASGHLLFNQNGKLIAQPFDGPHVKRRVPRFRSSKAFQVKAVVTRASRFRKAAPRVRHRARTNADEADLDRPGRTRARRYRQRRIGHARNRREFPGNRDLT